MHKNNSKCCVLIYAVLRDDENLMSMTVKIVVACVQNIVRRMMLRIDRVYPQHFGNYTLIANNSMGIARLHFQLTPGINSTFCFICLATGLKLKLKLKSDFYSVIKSKKRSRGT